VLRAHGVTDKGRIRPINEDCWAFEAAQGLCVVADGMGGHNAGEVAARVAVETIVTFLTTRTSDNNWPFGFDPALSAAGNRVRTAIQLAHMQVLETAVTSQRYTGMGTTIVASVVDGNRLSVGHVGDSRLYVLANDRLRQLTHDDSWMASMLAHNPSSADVARLEHHPMRNALTNVVGSKRRTDVHVVEEMLQGGELLLLTTDGVHGVLDISGLEQVILDSSGVEDTAASLVAAALARGSRDNCTALVARYLSE
jgi:serine/threonine protein phosphatase PrpC